MDEYELRDLAYEVMNRYVDEDKKTSVYDLLNNCENISDFNCMLIGILLNHEEREIIKKNISDKGCFNCTNASCKVKMDNDEFNDRYNKTCIGWENPTIIGKQLVYILKK